MINNDFCFSSPYAWVVGRILCVSIAVALVLTACQSATSTAPYGAHQAKRQDAPYVVDHHWPVLPDGISLGQAAGVDVDAQGRVFVFHRGSNKPGVTAPMKEDAVMILDSETGQLIDSWGTGKFVVPHGIDIDTEGNIWLADVGLHQVFKYTPEGELLLTLGEAGVPGNDALHFNMPTDIAVLADGSIYVTDGYGNNRVMVFSATGELIDIWGHGRGERPGEFHLPHSIESDDKNRLYVADRSNKRIQIFNHKGQFVEQWKNPEWGTPYAIKILNGEYYILDGGDLPGPVNRSRVYRVDNQGRVIEGFGRLGCYDGELFVAHDIAVDNKGFLYVVDIQGKRSKSSAKIKD